MSQSRAVAKALTSGFTFEPKAFDLISSLPPEVDVDGLVDSLLKKKAAGGTDSRQITEEDVRRVVPSDVPGDGEEAEMPKVVDQESEVVVISDPTPAIAPVEAFEGYARLFRDRYDRLLSIVRTRPDARGLG